MKICTVGALGANRNARRKVGKPESDDLGTLSSGHNQSSAHSIDHHEADLRRLRWAKQPESQIGDENFHATLMVTVDPAMKELLAALRQCHLSSGWQPVTGAASSGFPDPTGRSRSPM